MGKGGWRVEFCFDQVLVRREEMIQCVGEAWSGGTGCGSEVGTVDFSHDIKAWQHRLFAFLR